MTWFSLIPLLFVVCWLWDGAAHLVSALSGALKAAASEGGSGSAVMGASTLPPSGIAATVADGCLPAEPTVPA